MKKNMENKKLLVVIIGGIVAVLFIVLISMIAFGGKKTVCTMKSDQSKNGYVLETKYEIKSKGKNVKSVTVHEVITSEKKDIREKFAKQLEDQYSYNKKNYGGYSYKVSNKGNKVVSRVTIDYSKFDMKKFIKNNEAMKKYTKDNKFTLEGAKDLYESTGATCK